MFPLITSADWLTIGTALVLAVMGAWLAVSTSSLSRGTRIAWVSAFLIVAICGSIGNLWLVSNSRVDDMLQRMIQDVRMSAFRSRIDDLQHSLDLQGQVIRAQGDVVSTTKSMVDESIDRITGKKAYCYLVPLIMYDGHTMPLVAINPTSSVLFGVTADIMEQSSSFDTQEQSLQNLAQTVTVSLGNVGSSPPGKDGTGLRPLQYRIPIRKDKDNLFQITIFSQYSSFMEFLVVSWNNERWNYDYSLSRFGSKRLIHQKASTYPYIDERYRPKQTHP